ncbi:hypothetical protein [Methylicorpusculum sp.]|uniref:hypothetical protein n=1 Tax=Methylicorpusculum sp. TaxID=2713644 RepID=UPI00271CB9C2|nr:hypothetical protein [Methylicorpusculum sp.]MDO8846077.1 hypothetical protein [Methylicorpusculum sp.]
MITSLLRLKKTSDATYQEVNTNSQHRPIEWRGSYQPINFDLIDVKSEYIYKVHEYKYIPLSELENKSSLLTVIPNVYGIKRISATVDKESFRDSIYCLVPDEDEQTAFRVEKPKANIKVVLQSEEISDSTEEFEKGYYRGLCMYDDLEGNDQIYFELTLPDLQFTEIFNSLLRNPNSKLNVLVYLLAFTNEVDDAFREHYKPMDMFFYKITTALLSNVTVSSCFHGENIKKEDKISFDYSIKPDVDIKNSPSVDISLLNNSISKISFSLWVLICIAGYIAFK